MWKMFLKRYHQKAEKIENPSGSVVNTNEITKAITNDIQIGKVVGSDDIRILRNHCKKNLY